MINCGITGSTGVLGKKIRKILPYKFYCFKKDITNYYDVKEWIDKKNLDLVIHLAAVVPTRVVNKNYIKARKINVIGTKNLVNSIINSKNKPKWFFFSSTSHVYNISYKNKKINEKKLIQPISKYGKTKRDAELIIQKSFKKHGIIFCIGRIFSFTDKKQKKSYVIPSLIRQIKYSKKKQITLNNLNHYRDFLSTKDISLAIKKLFENKAYGVFNIGSGKKFSLENIAKLVAKKNKKNIKFINNKKFKYLISNYKKIMKLGWKPKKYKANLNYFY